MKYLSSALTFLNEELKAAKKEMGRLTHLADKDHNDEGQTINKAKLISAESGQYVYSYPAQFTKIRDEKKVEVFSKNRAKIGEAEVLTIDYLKNTVTLDTEFSDNDLLLVLSLEVAPFAIMNSLKKMISQGPSTMTANLVNRHFNLKTFGEAHITNINKTVDQMDNSTMVILGPPGCGKTTAAKGIVDHLLKKGKRILITSNSHYAINNLCKEITIPKDQVVKKINSKSHQQVNHDDFKNIYVYGKDITGQVSDAQLVAGTCFALSRIQDLEFDYLIVDEASQLKMAFLLSISRLAKNIIVLGDPNQLQSISILPETLGGESVLNYLMEKKRLVPDYMGYFLNKTYRMEKNIASVISTVFYEGKLGWNKDQGGKINLVVSDHSHGQKMSVEEAEEIVNIYKRLKKQKIKDENIIIITPYNAQVELIKSMMNKIKKNNKVLCSTVDAVQGQQATHILISLVSAGNKKESAEFATIPNRLNVAISRAISEVYLVASSGLIKSKHASSEFKQILKLIA